MTNMDRLRLHLAASLPDLEISLSTLGDGIADCQRRILNAPDAVVDRESDVLENLLGVTFLCCQVAITEVAAAAVDLRQSMDAVKRPPRHKFPKDEPEARKLAQRTVAPGFSDIEFIHQVANYYKHRRQFHDRAGWAEKEASASEKYTLRTIKKGGLKPLFTGNLRTAALALSVTKYEEVETFGRLIRDWAKIVEDAADKAWDFKK